ncbi:asparagine synthetase B, partial [Candidatus Woesearchaeota archaeon]
MCGIIGIFPAGEDMNRNQDAARQKLREKIEAGVSMLESRGRDGSGIMKAGNGFLGHALHAVVNHVPQPVANEKAGSILVANCEIYNWKELRVEHHSPKNDAEALLFLLDSVDLSDDREIERALSLLDGVYAFAYFRGGKLLVARDIIGVKPLWFSHSGGFAFASEKKVLEKLGFSPVFELNPRHFIVLDAAGGNLHSFVRDYFDVSPVESDISEDEAVKKISALLEASIKKRVPSRDRKVGVLFSGGVDSTLVALLLKRAGVDFTCYTTAVAWDSARLPEDLVAARKAAKLHGLPLKEILLSPDDVLNALPRIVPLIEDTNVVKVGVALALDAACRHAYADNCKVVFSGLGSEEIFAGYQRHRSSSDINRECLAGLRKIYERDLYRDDVVSMSNGVELRLPFLDRDLVRYSLKLPASLKIREGARAGGATQSVSQSTSQ